MKKSAAKRLQAKATKSRHVVESGELVRPPILNVLADWLQSRLIRLPRVARMLLAGGLALAVTAALFPLVDAVYILYLFNPETRIVPSYISTGIGAFMYLAGWYLIVGPRGEQRLVARPALAIYMIIGVLALCLDIILIVQGISMTDFVAG